MRRERDRLIEARVDRGAALRTNVFSARACGENRLDLAAVSAAL